jgi:TonB family protein
MEVLQLKVFTQQPATNDRPDISSFLSAVYIIVAFAGLVRIGWNWWQLYRFAMQGNVQHYKGYTLIRHQSVLSTFSFFNRIFYSDILPADSPVFRHEMAHVHGYHSLDKVLMEIICAVCWFNPFFFFMKRDLAMVHEFIADQEAGADAPASYAKVLLQMALRTQYLPGSSQFSQSPVKRRISMLFTHQTNNTIMKKMIMFPVAAALLFLMGSQQADVAVAANISHVSDTDKVYESVDNPPTFPGGIQALTNFLIANVHYPKTAQDAKQEGTVFVQFRVDADGTISDAKTVGRTLGYGLEDESVRVVNAMPKWTPGSNKGQKVAVMFHLPIRYEMKK